MGRKRRENETGNIPTCQPVLLSTSLLRQLLGILLSLLESRLTSPYPVYGARDRT